MLQDPQSENAPIRKVAFIIAMEGEARGFIDTLDLAPQGPLAAGHPAVWFHGDLEGGLQPLEVAVVRSGTDPTYGVDRIGTEPAVLAASLLCDRFGPDLLVNAGTCGGFQARGAAIGTIYLGSGAYLFHDRCVPLPGFQEFAAGRIAARGSKRIAEVLGVDRGIVSTGNGFTASAEDLAFFALEGVSAKDMEAAAIARLAEDLAVPFLALKGVTDLLDHPEPNEDAFLRNYEGVNVRLTASMVALVEWLQQGRTLGDLE